METRRQALDNAAQALHDAGRAAAFFKHEEAQRHVERANAWLRLAELTSEEGSDENE